MPCARRAARSPGWSGTTAYNRGQVLYRLAEMMEARGGDLAAVCSGRDEVERSIDRVVWYAGWADKLAQALGGANAVAGPYFNFTVPEPTGVVATLAPTSPRSRASSRGSCPRSSAATSWWRSRPSPGRWPRSSWPRRSPPRTCPAARSTS